MKYIAAPLILGLLLILGGCVPSLHPLFTHHDVVVTWHVVESIYEQPSDVVDRLRGGDDFLQRRIELVDALDGLLRRSTMARTLCEGVLDVGSSPHGAHTSPAACTMPAILCGRVWASDGLGSS